MSLLAKRPDWRGWIALAWVVFWGAAYLRMAVAPRASQAIASVLKGWSLL